MEREKNKKDLVSVRIKRLRDKKENHLHVILEKYRDKYVSVGLTTDPRKGKSKKGR